MIFFKEVTLSFAYLAEFSTVSAYVSQGYGRMQGAIYSNLDNQPFDLVETSAQTYTTAENWNTVTFNSDILTPGTYWIAVEVANTAQIQYSITGTDLYAYYPYGTWPNPATIQTFLGNASIQGFACGY